MLWGCWRGYPWPAAPGPLMGLPDYLFTLRSFCFSAPIIQLLTLTHSHMGATIPHILQCKHPLTSRGIIYVMKCNRGMRSIKCFTADADFLKSIWTNNANAHTDNKTQIGECMYTGVPWHLIVHGPQWTSFKWLLIIVVFPTRGQRKPYMTHNRAPHFT